MAELEAPKPCPFCGGHPKVIGIVEEADRFEREVMVRCDNCAVEISDDYRSGAIKIWNIRAPSTEEHLSDRTGSEAYTAEGKETLDDPSSPLRSLTTKLEEAERELAAARRRAAPVAGPDQGARREAAKKLLCDICACSAEAEPASLDLPHVVADCLEPLETLIAERDICLFLSQQAHKYLGRDGHDILDAIAERCAAESRALLAEAKLGEAETRAAEANKLLEDVWAIVVSYADWSPKGDDTCALRAILPAIKAFLSKAKAEGAR